MSTPAPKTRRKLPPESNGGFLMDWRVYAVVAMIFLFVAIPLVILLQMGTFDEYLPARVTQENYDQLRVGMKEKDIRKLLGRPTWIDKSAFPRLKGYDAKFRKADNAYPQRFVWEDEEDVIWADLLGGKVVKFGATLDGQTLGSDPDKKKLGKPDESPLQRVE